MARRPRDAYYTPTDAARRLLEAIPDIAGETVLEPCSGLDAIAAVLRMHGCCVTTNDLDRSTPAQFHADATDPAFWTGSRRSAWVVTNPPFSCAAQIVPLAVQHATRGVAMFLRLSYLEPVRNRGAWLAAHPPTGLIVLPRISFTGDGQTDTVTCAWMVWDTLALGTIRVIPKEAM